MKKGFTLIELVVTAAIIIMVAAYGLIKIMDYSKTKENFDMSLSKSMILALINDGKEYCRSRDSAGFIFFNIASQSIEFYCNGRRIDMFNMPKGAKLYNVNCNLNMVNIDRSGFTADACTITLKDNNSNISTLTICVGTGYAEIR